ncbi:MAG: chromate transporter [Xanthobacteraceae bacterium]|nr:chromate transporter [Xanthobacteraceae bacterium]
MRGEPGALAVLFVQFAILSFFALGGASTVVPELQRQMVEMRGALDDRQFSELYAIAQAAPGPNVMFVALLGHFIAGVPGAVVTTAAMCGPTCVLAYAVSRVFERFRAATLIAAIRVGLVPVTIGLIASSALIIARAADHDLRAFLVTGATFAVATWTRMPPLIALAGAAALGLAGLVR